MKTNLKTTVSCLAFILLFGQAFGQNKQARLYQAKSGIIEYELKGKTKGTQVTYFDDHGTKEATYTESVTKVLGMTNAENTLSLRLDSVVYTINLDEMTGVRMVIPFDPSQMTEKEMKEWEEWGKQMMSDMGFEKTGTGEVLGKKCEIWEGMGSKVWIWESMTLKTEVNIMGQWITEATKIDLNARIDMDKFKIPEGVELIDQEFDIDQDGDSDRDDVDALDSLASEIGKELGKSLNELKGILGGKKKKK